MEIVKEIKTELKTLKEINLKVIDLNVNDSEDEFYFLKDELEEYLKEKLIKNKLKYFKDLNIYFSLSYCQGDGVVFLGTIETDKAQFFIKHSGNYNHEYSKEIDIIFIKKGKKYIYPDEFDEKCFKKSEELIKEFDDLYISICKDIEKYGYNVIESQQKENILICGFNKWKEENNILCDKELFSFDYKTEEKEGYIKICNDGDTNIKGLWIKNQKIKISSFIKAKCEINDYKNIYLI